MNLEFRALCIEASIDTEKVLSSLGAAPLSSKTGSAPSVDSNVLSADSKEYAPHMIELGKLTPLLPGSVRIPAPPREEIKLKR